MKDERVVYKTDELEIRYGIDPFDNAVWTISSLLHSDPRLGIDELINLLQTVHESLIESLLPQRRKDRQHNMRVLNEELRKAVGQH